MLSEKIALFEKSLIDIYNLYIYIFNTLLVKADSDSRNDVFQTWHSIATNIILVREILFTWECHELVLTAMLLVVMPYRKTMTRLNWKEIF